MNSTIAPMHKVVLSEHTNYLIKATETYIKVNFFKTEQMAGRVFGTYLMDLSKFDHLFLF